jgi:predicted ester cyclase
MTRSAAASLLDPRPGLVQPRSLTVDGGLDPGRARHLVRIGQALYTFWHTGDVRWLHEAVDPSFTDRTLPPGRPQGIDGPVSASAGFRAAVPDLACELADLLVAGDKLAVRLRFTGHFTGTYNGIAGAGQPVDFIAFDIQHVGPDRITEDWHLEDNLTFLLQAGLATVAHA